MTRPTTRYLAIDPGNTESAYAIIDQDGRERTAVTTASYLAAISRWVDDAPANAARDAEARTWGRLAKVAEECGEVIQAYIGATGQNPRKGVTNDPADVRKELLDVAVTALAAHEHLTGNDGSSMAALAQHVAYLAERAGVTA